MEFRVLKPEEFSVWTEFCSGIFGDPVDYFSRHFKNDPWADPQAIFTAWEDGKLCGSVRVFTREIYLGGEKIRCGGIGEVCTAAEARGKGISSALLRMAIAYMNEHRMPVSMLFTGTNHHYAHHGWFTVPRRFVRWDVSGAKGEGALCEAPSFELLAALHDRYAANVDGVIVRSPEYWSRWVKGEQRRTAVWEKNGVPVAYAVYRAERGESFRLSECLGETQEDVAALLYALCQKYEVPAKVHCAACLAPYAEDMSEACSTMMRLNFPFTVKGREIRTIPELAALMTNSAFFDTDSY